MISANHFASIDAIDLTPITSKTVHPEAGEGWTPEKAADVEKEYRRFLYLMKMFPHEPTAPAVDVDTYWHYHILDTAKYAADCQHAFGYFLHHNPYIGLRGEGDEAVLQSYGERMRELYVQTFGETDGLYATAYSGAVPVDPATGQPAYCTRGASAYCTRGASAYCTRGASDHGVITQSAYCTRGASAYCTRGASACGATDSDDVLDGESASPSPSAARAIQAAERRGSVTLVQ